MRELQNILRGYMERTEINDWNTASKRFAYILPPPPATAKYASFLVSLIFLHTHALLCCKEEEKREII